MTRARVYMRVEKRELSFLVNVTFRRRCAKTGKVFTQKERTTVFKSLN